MNPGSQKLPISPLVEAALAGAGLTAAVASGPVLVAQGYPWRIVWANDLAAEHLGIADIGAISRGFISGAEPGARQLARLADRLTPEQDVADMRLRLRLGGKPDMVSLSCRRLHATAPLLLISIWGYRAPPLHGLEASVATTLEPPVALPSPAAEISPPVQAPAAAPLVDRRGNVRFLWRTTRTGELASITGALCEVVGCQPEQLIGQNFLASIAELRLDPENRLRTALYRQETWSGVEVLWPIAGTDNAVPVVLGGLPGYDRERQFDGFSGFGVIHLDRITQAPAIEAHVPEPAPQAVDDEETAASASHFATLADEVRADAAEREEAEALSATADEADLVARATSETAQAAPSDDREADAPDDGMKVEESATAAESAPPSEPLQAGTTQPESHAPEKAAAPEGSTPLPGSNVVPLRAWQRDTRTPFAVTATPVFTRNEAAKPAAPSDREPVADATPPAGTDPKQSPEKLVGLSPAERNAFREIARALGARAEKEKKADETAVASPATAQTSTTERPPEEGLTEVRAGEPARTETNAVPSDSGVATGHDNTAAPLTALSQDNSPFELQKIADIPAAESAPQLVADGAPTSEQPVAANADIFRVVDRLDSGVLVCRGGVAAYANKALLDMLGHASIDDLHRSGGVDRMFRGRDPGALSRDADGGAIPVIAANGDVLPLEVRVQSVEWDREPATLMTFRRTQGPELTARIRALELELRQREAEARETHSILDTATDGAILIDEDGRILTLNKSAQALFGYDQNEVVGETLTVLLARESHAPAMDYLTGLKSNGVKSVLNDGREIIGRANRGGAIPLFMTLGRVGSPTQQRFCAVLRDLTQWKKVERELGEAKRDAERASQLKSDFLAKVSHEIRTPLNAILGFAEVIMEERFGPVGNERYKDYLKDIHSSGTHVLSLVNDLLDLSKIEAGKLDLNFGAVDANRIVNECVSLIQTQATRERVIIRLSLAPRLPKIVADERSLRQIVINVLSNAVKFNEPGGQVIVSTALTDAGHAVIRIRDTGIGMNDKELETALEPFRQIATSRQTTGTGLGLPLTKALVEANRASFTIKSRKGEGTLVEVAFPQTRVLAE
jgi:PAS domain S-box-containing protein